MALLKASDFARMICEYLKTLPDCEVDDPQKVQKFLGLLDDEFKMGVDWAVKRHLIELTAPLASARPAPVARPVRTMPATRSASVFSAFTEEPADAAAEVA